MTMPNVIALHAPTMQSGKTKVAERLVEAHGYTLVKFAEPLKAMTRAFLTTLGFDPETIERMVEGDLKEQPVSGLGITPRRLMQTIGTEWGRNTVDPNLWTKAWAVKVCAILSAGGRVVADDTRFPNELAAARATPFPFTVYVHRPDTPAYEDHPSEGLLERDDFDCVLVNDETLDVLRKATDLMVAALDEGLAP